MIAQHRGRQAYTTQYVSLLLSTGIPNSLCERLLLFIGYRLKSIACQSHSLPFNIFDNFHQRNDTKRLSKRDIVGTEQDAKVAGVLKFRPSLACIALGQYLGAYCQ